jgi:ketosteroid isomerase-like protein
MSQQNVKVVRRAFSEFTIPGDPGPMVAASHPDFEMRLVSVGGGPATYRGEAGIRAFFRDVAESWESFRFEATEIRDLGEGVLVLGQVRGCGRGSGVEVDDVWAWIVHLEDGRAVSLRGYLDPSEALAAAGLSR